MDTVAQTPSTDLMMEERGGSDDGSVDFTEPLSVVRDGCNVELRFDDLPRVNRRVGNSNEAACRVGGDKFGVDTTEMASPYDAHSGFDRGGVVAALAHVIIVSNC